MDYEKMLATQKFLDDRILKKHGLTQDKMVSNEVLALVVELGEMANDYRKWKFWSTDRKPRPKLIEETCDVLHFFLSLANYLEINAEELEILNADPSYSNPVHQFIAVFGIVADLNKFIVNSERFGYAKSIAKTTLQHAFREYLGLVTLIGLSLSDLEAEYYRKNKINHERQDASY